MVRPFVPRADSAIAQQKASVRGPVKKSGVVVMTKPPSTLQRPQLAKTAPLRQQLPKAAPRAKPATDRLVTPTAWPMRVTTPTPQPSADRMPPRKSAQLATVVRQLKAQAEPAMKKTNGSHPTTSSVKKPSAPGNRQRKKKNKPTKQITPSPVISATPKFYISPKVGTKPPMKKPTPSTRITTLPLTISPVMVRRKKKKRKCITRKLRHRHKKLRHHRAKTPKFLRSDTLVHVLKWVFINFFRMFGAHDPTPYNEELPFWTDGTIVMDVGLWIFLIFAILHFIGHPTRVFADDSDAHFRTWSVVLSSDQLGTLD